MRSSSSSGWCPGWRPVRAQLPEAADRPARPCGPPTWRSPTRGRWACWVAADVDVGARARGERARRGHRQREGVDRRRSPGRAASLLGMDLVRLGLERAARADDALDAVTSLLEAHGQGGSGEEHHDEPYWSSFLLVDGDGGWVLETSGRSWVARPVGDGAADLQPPDDLHRLDPLVAGRAAGPTGTLAATPASRRASPTTASPPPVPASAVVGGRPPPTRWPRLRDHGTGPWGARRRPALAAGPRRRRRPRPSATTGPASPCACTCAATSARRRRWSPSCPGATAVVARRSGCGRRSATRASACSSRWRSGRVGPARRAPDTASDTGGVWAVVPEVLGDAVAWVRLDTLGRSRRGAQRRRGAALAHTRQVLGLIEILRPLGRWPTTCGPPTPARIAGGLPPPAGPPRCEAAGCAGDPGRAEAPRR